MLVVLLAPGFQCALRWRFSATIWPTSVADKQLEIIPRGCEHDVNVLASPVADKAPGAFVVSSRSGLATAKREVALPAGLVAFSRQFLDELLCGRMRRCRAN